ncbi:MAG: TusE/DsrC/DsvC family sulfur relay protein [Gammaproteobacteria bacterium]|jgi:tRNA 2-thiouridine synthesizing protein E|nr:TusE/DsrC/DsvC family sulfur relay protein [Gammaproteobacteria bacterium]MBT4605897.1 TusE/DsrC/DsvC family sulfur relay protein [Thiotrichales bacterium]MBT3472739.1 TusE/DsrC/DsvC family sulfur relay protein [Gammaproteobacteria bacterium]MBT3967645.1 TusE/DsrC/DsvC family sulfur relay protein [Gammaproteobacteria bacterium]MBT4081079.1 TusE/DsrC/DsvC family sulfur relay protein [Gammaproteobacteria bacterium]
MSYEVNGQTIETNPNGYLENQDDWNEEVGKVIAEAEGVEMSDKHWDLVNHLRDEFFNNGGSQPNDRNLVKAMSAAWGEKINSKDLYTLFPKQPSKQAGKIAGLPESRRKGGY